MTLDLFADLILLPLAIITWRYSKLVSTSIQFAFIGAIAVRCGMESLRAISAVTGLAGAIEIGVACKVDVRMKFGVLLLGSMVVDGTALLAYRATGDWMQPLFQIGIVAVMAYVCLEGSS
jgi:hypothetical protein